MFKNAVFKVSVDTKNGQKQHGFVQLKHSQKHLFRW